jgi:hypothetical protein
MISLKQTKVEALKALDTKFLRAEQRVLKNESEEFCLTIMHKARYECSEISEKLKLESKAWLIENGQGRLDGNPWRESDLKSEFEIWFYSHNGGILFTTGILASEDSGHYKSTIPQALYEQFCEIKDLKNQLEKIAIDLFERAEITEENERVIGIGYSIWVKLRKYLYTEKS